MERAKRKVRVCLIFVVMLAVVLGIIYYYNEMRSEDLEAERTLVQVVPLDWNSSCQ